MDHLISLITLVILFPAVVLSGGQYSDLHAVDGRSVTANLFEWRFDDIAEECETFLGPYGYAAVQISPVLEYAKLVNPYFEPAAVRPWYERYQPVSYKIISRSGDEAQLADMVSRCNKAGVRVIVDLVMNHMSGSIDGEGTGGSPFQGSSKNYPEVPYSDSNFHSKQLCGTSDGSIQDYNNPNQVRNCELSGLRDLDQSQEYVRGKMVDAINRLVDLGVAGFRMDASKHIWPADLEAIFSRVHDLNTQFFPPSSRPFLAHEVQPGGAVTMQEYTRLGRVLEFNYRRSIVDVFRKYNNQRLKYLQNFGVPWSFVGSGDAVPLVDNHDLQRSEVLTGINFRQFRLYKMATAFMLAWPYGLPNVMSSYDWPINMVGVSSGTEPALELASSALNLWKLIGEKFLGLNPVLGTALDIAKNLISMKYLSQNVDQNKYMSPPMDANQNIERVVRNPDLSCAGRWKCEHRWRQIYNMVRFRNTVGNEPVSNWWDNGQDAIAFSRGSRGFLIIVNQGEAISQRFQTGLPGGSYCDVISGNLIDGKCTGSTINVDSQGYAQITIDGANADDPMVAIHVDAKLSTRSEILSAKPSTCKLDSSDFMDKITPTEDEMTLDYCSLCVQSLAKRKVDPGKYKSTKSRIY